MYRYSIPRHVTGITCTESLSLFLGSSRQLEAKVIPDNVWDNSVIWESLNSDIATVDASGKVYGKTLGATEVVAKTNDGDLKLNVKLRFVKLTNSLQRAVCVVQMEQQLHIFIVI